MGSKVCLGIAVCLFAVSSTSAVAAPVDVASDHVALRAFDRYLRGQASDAPAARQSADAFVASISANCPSVLSGTGIHQTGSLTNAEAAFAFEIGGDIAVVAAKPNRIPLAHMTRVLSKLRWSNKSTTATVTHFLATEHNFFYLAPSELCTDASALAANTQVTPPGTGQWLTTFVPAVRAANARSTAFVKTLRRFEDAEDVPVIKDIARVAGRVGSAAQTLANAEVPKLLAALGVAP
jgi:hypothetical protein